MDRSPPSGLVHKGSIQQPVRESPTQQLLVYRLTMQVMDAETGNRGLLTDTRHTHLTAARRAKLLRFTTTLFVKGHSL